ARARSAVGIGAAAGLNVRRWGRLSAAEEPAEEVDRVRDVDALVVVRVERVDARRVDAAAEEIIERRDRIRDVDRQVRVRVGAQEPRSASLGDTKRDRTSYRRAAGSLDLERVESLVIGEQIGEVESRTVRSRKLDAVLPPAIGERSRAGDRRGDRDAFAFAADDLGGKA